jgi:Lsr2
MTKTQVVSYDFTCDVCGDPIPAALGEDATRKLSWEGSLYVVDVCAPHGTQLGGVLAELKGFVDAGHRESGRRGRPANASSTGTPSGGRSPAPRSGAAPKRGDLGAIRVWARENGHSVSERGRIPGALISAYDAAVNAAAAVTPKAGPPRKRAPRKAATTRKRAPRKAAPVAEE